MNMKKGFTLVETLVAITVLLVAIGGPLSIAQQGLSAAFFSRDQVSAFYLAQEAIEYVRKVRDGNGIKTAGGTPTYWLLGLDSECTGANPCYFDAYDGGAAISCGASCPPLRYDTSRFTYGYDGSDEETIFTREVRVTPVVPGPPSSCGSPPCPSIEAVVSVTVSWQTRNIPKTMTVIDHLFNWQQ